MFTLKTMTVSKKLIIAFLILSGVTGLVGYLGIKNMGVINSLADEMYKQEVLGISYVKEANVNLINASRAVRNLLLASSIEDRQQFLKSIDNFAEQERLNLERAEPLIADPEAKRLLQQYKETSLE